jgi:hypothetical protein
MNSTTTPPQAKVSLRKAKASPKTVEAAEPTGELHRVSLRRRSRSGEPDALAAVEADNNSNAKVVAGAAAAGAEEEEDDDDDDDDDENGDAQEEAF